ncbi:MAG TPA: RNA polymerase sigma factor [Steroidobacteraceae bacterium]|nr:RNA polymerase sigma factor [Burkholderiales bacterium]HVO47885.1 RNA polymerase sigma factor [Steroidobacteraceae bacterium]
MPSEISDTRSNASSDAALMERVAGGDAQAFRMLVERYLPRAHAVARRMLGSAAEAEDAVQEAFCRIWTHAAAFRAERAAFFTWAYRIIANACLDAMRRRTPAAEPVDDMAENLADPAPDAQSRHESLQVRQAVQALPPRQRLAVVLCYFEGMTNPEAAAAMDMNVKALEGLLVRARRSLRNRLDG